MRLHLELLLFSVHPSASSFYILFWILLRLPPLSSAVSEESGTEFSTYDRLNKKVMCCTVLRLRYFGGGKGGGGRYQDCFGQSFTKSDISWFLRVSGGTIVTGFWRHCLLLPIIYIIICHPKPTGGFPLELFVISNTQPRRKIWLIEGNANACRNVPLRVNFFRRRHFALISVSLIFLRLTPHPSSFFPLGGPLT